MTIAVHLPDGRVVNVEAPDAQSAALAARKFLARENSNASGVDEAGMIASEGAPIPPQPELNLQELAAQKRARDLRALGIGAQGAAKGTGEAVFAPADIADIGANLGLAGLSKASKFFGGPSIDFRFPIASEQAAKVGSDVANKVGIPLVDPEKLPFSERAAYNINRIGAQTALAIPFMASAAASRAANVTKTGPKPFDEVLRPYGQEASGKTIAGDAAAAAGAGTGITAAQAVPDKVDNVPVLGTLDLTPYKPALSTIAALFGGMAGADALPVAKGVAKAASIPARKMLGSNLERSPVFVDPETKLPATTGIANQAASIVQNHAVDKTSALGNMFENRAALEGKVGVLPSAAALSEDPGLAVLQRKFDLTNPGEKIARDQQFQTGVRNTLDQVAPADATSEPLRQAAQAKVDQITAPANERVARAERGVNRLNKVRQGQAGKVGGYEGAKAGASEALDSQIVNNSLRPLIQQKNSLYEAIPNTPLEGGQFHQEASQIRAGAESLPPHARNAILPEEQLRDFESLAVRDEEGHITGFKPLSSADAERMRPQLAAEIKRAREANASPEYLDNLESLRQTINQATNNIPEAATANQFYREKVSPVYGKQAGEGYKFRKDFNKDQFGRTFSQPPTTAGRFIQPGRPDKSEALSRIFDTMPDPAQAQAAAREYMMADLAGKNVIDAKTGALRPDALKRWALANDNNLDLVPGFRDEVQGYIDKANKGERIAGDFATELKAAREAKGITDEQVNKSALSDVLKADPDKTVASVMSGGTDSGQRLKELVDLTANDEAARTGLKAAVRDYLINKATTTASEKLVPGDTRGPVSFANLTKLFNEHANELAQIFTPEEMNTLRAGHRALELANIDRLRVSTGSDTAEKTNIIDQFASTPLGKGVEAFARLKFGLLKAGGFKATVRRLAEGIGSDEASQIARLVQRATVDPELMGLLLGRDVPIDSPRWNAKMNSYRAYLEGGRQEYKDQKQ